MRNASFTTSSFAGVRVGCAIGNRHHAVRLADFHLAWTAPPTIASRRHQISRKRLWILSSDSMNRPSRRRLDLQAKCVRLTIGLWKHRKPHKNESEIGSDSKATRGTWNFQNVDKCGHFDRPGNQKRLFSAAFSPGSPLGPSPTRPWKTFATGRASGRIHPRNLKLQKC